MRGSRDRNREQALRSEQTHAEALLWHQLRTRRFLEFKFRRQHPIGSYIVDFACIERKLVVELDGSQHLTQVEYDQTRTRYLETRGFVVVRFWNNEVMARTDSVLEEIARLLEAAPHPALCATLSPQAGRG